MFSIRHSLLKLSPLLYITDFLQLTPCFFVFQYCYANLELCLKAMAIKSQMKVVIKILLLTPIGVFRYALPDETGNNIEVKFN